MHETFRHFVESGWAGDVDPVLLRSVVEENAKPADWSNWHGTPEPMYERRHLQACLELAKDLADSA